MANWLFKTEPGCYSWSDLTADKKTCWDGVTNNLALKHLREVKKGDRVLFYHTGDEKQIVGIAEVTCNPYVDPGINDPKIVVVDIKPVRQLKRPVTLAQVKSNKKLEDFLLVKMSRLSIMPVTEEQWNLVLSGEKVTSKDVS